LAALALAAREQPFVPDLPNFIADGLREAAAEAAKRRSYRSLTVATVSPCPMNPNAARLCDRQGLPTPRGELEWHGGRFMVIDHDSKVIGEVDPGFRPLPEDVEWAAKVEYAMHYILPHPYGWTKKLRDDYERLHP